MQPVALRRYAPESACPCQFRRLVAAQRRGQQAGLVTVPQRLQLEGVIASGQWRQGEKSGFRPLANADAGAVLQHEAGGIVMGSQPLAQGDAAARKAILRAAGLAAALWPKASAWLA